MDMVLAFFIGLAGGTIGAISTGAALIYVPGLIFAGLSPISAIATTRLGSLSAGITTVYRYNKAKAVLWRYVPPLLLVAVIGGFLGPKLLLGLDQNLVEKIIGILLILMIPVLFLKHGFGQERKTTSRRRKLIGLVALLLVTMYGTAFGMAQGTFMIYVLVYFWGMTLTEGNATGTALFLVATLTAIITYVHEQVVDFSLGIPLVVGAAIGGYLGAQLALKKGLVWVKYVLAVVLVVSAVKLLFF